VQALREITGHHFGYEPGAAPMPGMSVATATPEERERAVRRWFGWWKHNKRSFTGREEPPPDEGIGG